MVQTVAEGSPAIRARALQRCLARPLNASTAHEMAALMNVKGSQARSVSCHRIIEAMSNGRLTYEDVKSVWGTPTPHFIKIMQGR